MDRHRFLILDNPISAQDTDRLLGRLALNYKNPLDESEPLDPSEISKSYLQGVISEKASKIFASVSDNQQLKVALEPFFSLFSKSEASVATTLESSFVETHRLRNHNKVFEKIMKQYEKDIKDMMDLESPKYGVSPEKIYMVIGYKCLFDPTRNVKVENEKATNVNITIPIGPAVNALAPGVLPLESKLVGTGGGEVKDSLDIGGQFVGKIGFAVEYKVYKKSKILSFFRRKEIHEGWVPGSVLAFPPGVAMGRYKGDEDLVDYEDEDEDAEDFEDYKLCRLGLDDFYVPSSE